MTIFEMLGQSAILTLLGMGIVFGFLIILVVVISLFGRLLGTKEKGENKQQAKTPDVNSQLTAAITAAVTEYQKSSNLIR